MTTNPATESAERPAAQNFPADTRLAQHFDDFRSRLPDGDGSVVRRLEAMEDIQRVGVPNRRVEEWKYTDLRAFLHEAAAPASRPDAATVDAARKSAHVLADVPAARIDFVNGYLADAATLPEGVSVVPLSKALAEAHPALASLDQVEVANGNALIDLNTAFVDDGIIVQVAAGHEIGEVLHLRFINHGNTPFATATRVLVLVEKDAALTIAETHEGHVAAQPNSLVAFVLGDSARVEHVRVNAEGAGAIALSTLTALLGEADFRSFNLVAGSAVSRHQLFIACQGENARVTIGGVTMIRGEDHADTTLVLDHAVPGGESRELFKTIVDGDATGVFQGKIIVRQDAQKTDGRMMSAALLVSPGATMYNKPELEIWADDVQCAHGATCGELDEDLLFYLSARGLPPAEAEALLLQAFIGEAIELVEHESMREALNALAVKRLENRS